MPKITKYRLTNAELDAAIEAARVWPPGEFGWVSPDGKVCPATAVARLRGLPPGLADICVVAGNERWITLRTKCVDDVAAEVGFFNVSERADQVEALDFVLALSRRPDLIVQRLERAREERRHASSD